VGQQASLERLRTPARPPAVVLLATHANASDTDGAFIAVAPSAHHNGLATPRDILELQLPGSVVILSACRTGSGRITGDGIDGLSRAFLVGGATALLLTLYEVVEPVAFELVYQFLCHWRDGNTVGEALRAAQRDIAVQEYDDIALWAPFTLVGLGQ
jgi:CHAT domain-containing protein